MKPNIKDKDTMTVQETVVHYKLSRRKFYELLHLLLHLDYEVEY